MDGAADSPPTTLFALQGPVLLASTSRYRRAQLDRLGLPYTAVAPPYDEVPVAGLHPAELVAHHARGKVESLVDDPRARGAFVVGADQGVVFADPALGGAPVLLGKAGSVDAAAEQLLRLAGHGHELVTALAVRTPDGALVEHVEVAEIRVRSLTRDEALAYAAHDETWDCAGSYKIERAGPSVLERLSCQDPSAIEGLPLIALCRILRGDGATATRP